MWELIAIRFSGLKICCPKLKERKSIHILKMLICRRFKNVVQNLQYRNQRRALSNLRLCDNWRWVISDFGLCTFLDPEEHREITNPNEKVGPAFWMSPEAIDCSYFENDLIGTHSDVFQLCAVFAFVLTKRFPGGIIQDSNSLNTTPEIRDVLVRSLSNDYSQRPVDGSALVVQYNNATYARTWQCSLIIKIYHDVDEVETWVRQGWQRRQALCSSRGKTPLYCLHSPSGC